LQTEAGSNWSDSSVLTLSIMLDVSDISSNAINQSTKSIRVVRIKKRASQKGAFFFWYALVLMSGGFGL
jgi:hypothetical protein